MTLNVDGLGEYADSPAARMDAILTRVLLVEPDVLVLQEVTAPMLTQLRRRLPKWKVCRRSEVLEYYFNVTVMRHGSERTTSFPFPASSNGRHLITTRLSRDPTATGRRARASLPVTHEAAPSPSSSATGPAATPSSATGQAARALRQRASVMLPRRRPPMLGRCPLWPLATLSCSAPRRCATRA